MRAFVGAVLWGMLCVDAAMTPFGFDQIDEDSLPATSNEARSMAATTTPGVVLYTADGGLFEFIASTDESNQRVIVGNKPMARSLRAMEDGRFLMGDSDGVLSLVLADYSVEGSLSFTCGSKAAIEQLFVEEDMAVVACASTTGATPVAVVNLNTMAVTRTTVSGGDGVVAGSQGTTTTSSFAYFGMGNSRLLRIDRTTLTVDTVQTGCCAMNALTSFNGVIYAGTDVGLVFRIVETTMDADNYVFVGSPCVALVADPAGVIFAVGNDGVISRLDIDPSSSISLTEQWTPVAPFPATGAVLSGPALFVVAGDRVMREFITHDCTLSTTCATCAVDNYCAFCRTNARCLETSASCGTPRVIALDGCPVVLSVEPGVVAAAGGAMLNLVGSNFVASTNLKCDVNGATSTATVVSDEEVTCPAPGSSAGVQGARLTVGGREYASGIALEYVVCSTLDCASCGMQSGCAWCPNTGACVALGSCSGPELITCPLPTTIFPRRASLDGAGVTVAVTSTFIYPSSSYICKFGPDEVAATVVSENLLTCTPPTGGSPRTVQFSVHYPDAATNYFESFTADFDFYRCTDASTCDTCLDGTEVCAFCFSSSTCDLAGSLACADPATYRFDIVCPAVSSVTPAVFTTNMASSVTVAVDPKILNDQVKCRFFDGLLNEEDTVATVISATELTCAVPSVSEDSATTVRLLFGAGEEYWSGTVNPEAELSFFGCATYTDCGTCQSSSGTLCGWCLASSSCATAISCADNFLGSGGTCPSINSVLPPSTSRAGGATVTVAGSFLSSSPSYQCSFDTERVPASWKSPTELECITPAFSASETANVEVYSEDVLYSSTSLIIGVYDCFGLTTCSECRSDVSRPECGWCVQTASCASASECDGEFESAVGTCPLVTLSPNSGASEGGTTITVSGAFTVDSALYTCEMSGVVVPATVLSASTLQCLSSPAVDGSEAAEVSINYDGRPYTAVGVPFSYYECSGASDCSTCSSGDLSDCQWCPEENACTITCAVPAVSCPALTGFGTKSTGASYGSSLISVHADNYVDTSAFAYSCSFDGSLTEATRVSSTEVQCLTAPHESGLSSVQVYLGDVPYGVNEELFIYYDCADLSTCEKCNNDVFEDCGWCLSNVSCVTQQQCPSFFENDRCPGIGAVRPVGGDVSGGTVVVVVGSLFRVGLPFTCDFGNISVDATVTASGDITCTAPPALAEGSVALSVSLGSVPNYVTEGSVFEYYECARPASECATCENPAKPECGFCSSTGTCAVATGCAAGFESVCVSSIVADGEAVGSTGTSGGIIALIVILILLLLFVIVAGVVYKIVYLGGSRDFSPPTLSKKDVIIMRFGKEAAASSGLGSVNGSSSNANVVSFAESLVDTNFALAMLAVAPPVESESISRALLAVFLGRGQALELLTAQATAEIGRSKTLSTVFRTNSQATQMYQYYAKICGFHYIRDTIGSKINEILDQASVEVDEKRMAKDDDAMLQKWALQVSCQKIFVAIIQSEVPPELRSFFHTAASEIHGKFGGLTTADLSENILDTIQDNINMLQQNYEAAGASFTDLRNVADSTIDPSREKVGAFASQVNNMSEELDGLLRAFEDAQAASEPSSTAAQAVLQRQREMLNSVAVGGFMFLRFVIPAISSPEQYGIPQPGVKIEKEHRRMLTLISKVLMNLSNNKEFGAKEPYMKKLNEFITTNQGQINSFFERMTVKPTQPLAEVEVPAELVNSSLVLLQKAYTAQEMEVREAYKELVVGSKHTSLSVSTALNVTGGEAPEQPGLLDDPPPEERY